MQLVSMALQNLVDIDALFPYQSTDLLYPFEATTSGAR
jgi:hypothetical protein